MHTIIVIISAIVLLNKNQTLLLRCPPHLEVASYTVPYTVTSICDRAFESSRIPTINILSVTQQIAENAFCNAYLLERIFVASDNPYYSSLDGVLYNKDSTKIISCPKGQSAYLYILPEGLITIGDYAFYNCDDLTSVTIPSTVQTIGSNSFQFCNSLREVTIPYTVTSIGSSAFEDCDSLVIRCVKNSAAYNYAIDNNIAFTLYDDPAVTHYELNKSDLTLYTASFNEYLSVSNTQAALVTWTSSNTGVATVLYGAVTPISPGTATITATYNGFRFTCKVTILQSEISMSTARLRVGKTLSLNITGISTDIIWRSSKSSIASVKNGVITAKKPGTVTITATVNGKVFRCVVTVRK